MLERASWRLSRRLWHYTYAFVKKLLTAPVETMGLEPTNPCLQTRPTRTVAIVDEQLRLISATFWTHADERGRLRRYHFVISPNPLATASSCQRTGDDVRLPGNRSAARQTSSRKRSTRKIENIAASSACPSFEISLCSETDLMSSHFA